MVHENPGFERFIRDLLAKQARLNPDRIDIIIKNNLDNFLTVFTHKSVDQQNNYEFLEILGDVTVNKIVVQYYLDLYKKEFIGKNNGGNMGAVAILSRLKISGVQKKTLSDFGNSLGFWNFARVDPSEIKTNKDRQSLIEDMFEAFIGCLETVVDLNFGAHTGHGICYVFMKPLIDTLKISTNYDDLYDSKTKVNEKVHMMNKMIQVKYETRKTSDTRYESYLVISPSNEFINICRININPKRTNTRYGYERKDVERLVAEDALNSNLFEDMMSEMKQYCPSIDFNRQTTRY